MRQRVGVRWVAVDFSGLVISSSETRPQAHGSSLVSPGACVADAVVVLARRDCLPLVPGW